ncbi:hypothetical protein B0H12DRAFT_1078164 [Mycena haematopus]|nr:hypothetical protein B0H12DRAFT_1078164 [Mycena haematopus]
MSTFTYHFVSENERFPSAPPHDPDAAPIAQYPRGIRWKYIPGEQNRSRQRSRQSEEAKARESMISEQANRIAVLLALLRSLPGGAAILEALFDTEAKKTDAQPVPAVTMPKLEVADRDLFPDEKEEGRANLCGDEDDDNKSTDASLNSESESGDEDVSSNTLSHVHLQNADISRAARNAAALEEQQAISQSIDLVRYLEQKATRVGLSPEERASMEKVYGQLTSYMSELRRVMDLPPPPTAASPSTSSENGPAPMAPNPKKRKQVLPPSP